MIRAIVVALSCAACEKSAPPSPPAPEPKPDPKPAWWCLSSSKACEAERTICDRLAGAMKVTCTAQSTASCWSGCDGAKPPVCETRCFTATEVCESDRPAASPQRCRDQPVPARPELYPDYLEPGWWCYEAEIKGVTLSECEKYRDACEHALADLRPTASRTSACSRLAQSPVCFRFDVPTPLNPVQFMCFPSTQHCEEGLARGRANWPTNPSLDKVRLITACETWRGEEAP